VIGAVHATFVDSPILDEIATHGKRRGNYFFDDLESQETVIAALEGYARTERGMTRRTLLELTRELKLLVPEFATPGPIPGPQSLLHGDLYPSNIILMDSPHQGENTTVVKLIDWDRAGVGPICFDLAFIMEKRTSQERDVAWSAYRDRMECHFETWPSDREWSEQLRRVRLGRIMRAVSTYVALAENGSGEYPVMKLQQVQGWLAAVDSE
jgi:thiamine kinase-like enzyme